MLFAFFVASLVVPFVAIAQVSTPRDVPAQPKAEGSAVIRGRITRADDGQPLRGVTVSLLPREPRTIRNLPVATTDASGRYELSGLPGARYTLTAARSGYVTWQFGQRRPFTSGSLVAVEDGQALEQVDIALPRASAIAGVLIDQYGEPVTGALVQALRYRYVDGERRLVSASGYMDQTDDLGEFRVHGLAPGDYVLSASVLPSRLPPDSPLGVRSVTIGSVVSYYPGTATPAAAQTIHVALGQDVSGVSMLMAPVPLATISGTVQSADGSPPGVTSVRIGQNPLFSSSNGGFTSSGVPVGPDGSFSIANMPPGRYTLEASPMPRSDVMAWAQVDLDGSDVVVPLVLRRGASVRGRVTFDGKTPPPKPSAPGIVNFENVDPSQVLGYASPPTVRDDWTFEVAGLTGVRRFAIRPPEGWWLSSIRQGDRDLTDAALDFGGPDLEDVEIRLTDRPTVIRGVVRDPAGEPALDAAVVVFADDPSRWGPATRYVTVLQPDHRGRFEHRGLPPGRYLVVALEYLEPGEETNPQTLQRLRPFGETVALVEGEPLDTELAVRQVP